MALGSGTDSARLGLNLNYDAAGNLHGGGINLSASDAIQKNGQATGHSMGANLGYQFDSGGNFSSISAKVDISGSTPGPIPGQDVGYTHGAGLTFHKGGDVSLNVTQDISLNTGGKSGLVGTGVTVDNSFRFSPTGSLTDVDQQIATTFKFKTTEQARAEAAAKLAGLEREIILELEKAEIDEDRLAALQAEHEVYAGRLQEADTSAAKIKALISLGKDLGDQLYLYEDLIAKGIADPEKLTEDEKHLLGELQNIYGNKNASRVTPWEKFSGAFADTVDWLTGQNADSAGYVDEQGEFAFRTCFTRGTLIRVHPQTNGAILRGKSYYKAIEKIAVGDQVLSYNQGSGQVEYNRVARTFINQAEEIVKVSYSNGTVLETTKEHPFFIKGKGWVAASKIKTGMQSVAARSIQKSRNFIAAALIAAVSVAPLQAAAAEPQIVSVETEQSSETVYNFEVEHAHTYFVGEDEVLVHNECGASGIGIAIAITSQCKNSSDPNCINNAYKASTEGALVGTAIGAASGAVVIGGMACLAYCGPALVAANSSMAGAAGWVAANFPAAARFLQLAPQATPVVTQRVTLTQGGLDHIVKRHWHSAGTQNAGKFAEGVTGQKLKELLTTAAATGTRQPNTNNRPGQIIEYTFKETIGVTSKGAPTSKMKMVLNPDGTIKTAYPY